MEYDKINNLLGSQSEQLSRFVTREFVKVNDLSGGVYSENKQIRFKTPMLRSDLCDYSDAYILVKGTITVTANAGQDNGATKRNRSLILKNNAPFLSCISKINGEVIENAEDLDIVMPMYNLLEYSKNYRKTVGSFYNYYRDELSDDADNDNHTNIQVVNSKAFRCKTKITESTNNVVVADANMEGTQKVELGVPLKYLGNFSRSLNMPLISCEVSLEVTVS